MPASLPPRPNLEWLRKTAKDRLMRLRADEPSAKLADAQRAVAREYGFSSWRALKARVLAPGAAPEAMSESPRDEAVRRFFQLVGTGQTAVVRAVLDAEPRLAQAIGPHPFWGGRPQALHVAIEADRREVFDLLLERGADVNGSNDQYDHWSPLMLAIQRNRPAMRDALIDRGARIGLLEALMLGDDQRVGDWLADGRLPDSTPNAGSILAFARTPYAIDRLIALGAPLSKADRWGATPIEAMSRLGERGQALVAHMRARGVPAAPQEYARLGDLETLARLQEMDPSVSTRDPVMMAAVDFRHHAIVEWLLARGGPVNARSDAPSRHTALHAAAWNGDLEMVEILLAAGAAIDARDEQYHATPQGWAETSIEVTNNAACRAVVECLRQAGTR
jgi:ankyrin repeat protein